MAYFLKHQKKEWHENQLKEKRKLRRLPKWHKNMPADVFLRIIRYLKFESIFTKFSTINRQTRTIIFKNYVLLAKERMIVADLSTTTKILRKLPRYMQKRLNYVKIILTPEATTERIVRVLEFIKPVQNRVRILMECKNIDDGDKPTLSRIMLFQSFPLFSIFMYKCNFQDKKSQTVLWNEA